MTAPVNVLDVSALEVHYGGIRAVKGVDLRVAQGELVCLIGANGAGKSSTLRAISGMVPAKSGVVRYDNADIAGLRAFEHQEFEQGAVVVQGRSPFPVVVAHIDRVLPAPGAARDFGRLRGF